MEPKLLKMKWKKAFFAHWDWDPSDVEARLPKGLQLDTFNGRAYLGVVPFLMEDIRLAVMPSGTGLAFPELNLRTYVTLNGEKGVYFFNLDASSALGVYLARKLFAIPYYQADFSVSTAQESIQFAHKRKNTSTRFDAVYKGDKQIFYAEKGSLEHWLTERYIFYTSRGRNGLFEGRIAHKPWPLQRGSWKAVQNDLFRANRFAEPSSVPHLLYSGGIDVTASRLIKLNKK